MAKYLDSNGLSHFMGILKGLLHKHTVTVTPSTTTITPVTKKTVVTSHTAMSAVPDSTHPATLKITADSATTGDSVTAGTAATVVTGITSATTGSAHITDNS